MTDDKKPDAPGQTAQGQTAPGTGPFEAKPNESRPQEKDWPRQATQQQSESPPPLDGESGMRHHDDVIADLRREVSDLKDRILRAHAEVDNIRKRTEQEKKDTAKYAITRFAADIVNVGDNFQRAISAVPAGAADTDPNLKSLLDGVTLSEREFLNVLERHGIKRVDPKGEPFNPHLHQAVMNQPSSDVASNTVLQVFQHGFTIEDRVLRPAMVVVSTGGPKPQPVEAEAKPSGPPPLPHEAEPPSQSAQTSEPPADAGPSKSG